MRQHQKGMTLIELIIVIALLAILAAAAAPFTTKWVESARITETHGILEQAVGQARAAALRNPTALSGDTPASKICNDSTGVHIVLPIASNSVLDCASPPAQPWLNKLPLNTTIKQGANDWSCACFNNRGLLTNSTASCTGCATSLALTIIAGSENDTKTFH